MMALEMQTVYCYYGCSILCSSFLL